MENSKVASNWSILEQLLLAQSVYKYGDGNWSAISNTLKRYSTIPRPKEFFSQNNCALQYAMLVREPEDTSVNKDLLSIDNQEDKNRTHCITHNAATSGMPPLLLLAKKLYMARIAELKVALSEDEEKHRQLRREVDDIKEGRWDNLLLGRYMQEYMLRGPPKFTTSLEIHVPPLSQRASFTLIDAPSKSPESPLIYRRSSSGPVSTKTTEQTTTVHFPAGESNTANTEKSWTTHETFTEEPDNMNSNDVDDLVNVPNLQSQISKTSEYPSSCTNPTKMSDEARKEDLGHNESRADIAEVDSRMSLVETKIEANEFTRDNKALTSNSLLVGGRASVEESGDRSIAKDSCPLTPLKRPGDDTVLTSKRCRLENISMISLACQKDSTSPQPLSPNSDVLTPSDSAQTEPENEKVPQDAQPISLPNHQETSMKVSEAGCPVEIPADDIEDSRCPMHIDITNNPTILASMSVGENTPGESSPMVELKNEIEIRSHLLPAEKHPINFNTEKSKHTRETCLPQPSLTESLDVQCKINLTPILTDDKHNKTQVVESVHQEALAVNPEMGLYIRNEIIICKSPDIQDEHKGSDQTAEPNKVLQMTDVKTNESTEKSEATHHGSNSIKSEAESILYKDPDRDQLIEAKGTLESLNFASGNGEAYPELELKKFSHIQEAELEVMAQKRGENNEPHQLSDHIPDALAKTESLDVVSPEQNDVQDKSIDDSTSHSTEDSRSNEVKLFQDQQSQEALSILALKNTVPQQSEHSPLVKQEGELSEDDHETSDTETSDTGSSCEKKEIYSSFIEDKVHKNWIKLILMVWREIASHRFGGVFMHPIKEQTAPGYYELIKRPMDLKSIKQRIREGIITTTDEFHRDILLMFQNALLYNKTDSEIYNMAMEMREQVEQEILIFKKTEGFTEGAVLETPTTRRKANNNEA